MNDAGETIRRLEALIGRKGVAEDYARLRIALLRVQAEVLAELLAAGGEAIESAGGGEDENTALAIPPETVPLDLPLARRLFTATVEIVAKHGSAGGQLRRLRSAAQKEPGLIEELIRRAALAGDGGYVASLEVPAELLLFVARIVAAPFVTAAAVRIEQSGAEPPGSDGYCPLCGSPPGLAELRAEDGGRVLHCSLCGHRWQFARLVCPICGAKDQSALGTLRVDAEQARWIETCDRCRHYLKTIDGRRLPEGEELVPLVEEVARMYLDLLAEREGFHRGAPLAALR